MGGQSIIIYISLYFTDCSILCFHVNTRKYTFINISKRRKPPFLQMFKGLLHNLPSSNLKLSFNVSHDCLQTLENSIITLWCCSLSSSGIMQTMWEKNMEVWYLVLTDRVIFPSIQLAAMSHCPGFHEIQGFCGFFFFFDTAFRVRNTPLLFTEQHIK